MKKAGGFSYICKKPACSGNLLLLRIAAYAGYHSCAGNSIPKKEKTRHSSCLCSHLFMEKPFKIYTSSAGSGKTYTLTKEYLKLALKNDDPFYFRHILAITFTNDAANEMKERILAALRGFADPESLPEGRRAGNQQLLDVIVQELNQTERVEMLTEKMLRRRAGRTFSHILHDYSDFAVSTIDSFVNRLVGAFTEELDIPFNYEVTMEGLELVSNAVDRMLNRIGHDEEQILSEMLEAYALEITDEGKSWNGLSVNLAEFGNQLLNEKMTEVMERIRSLTLDDFRAIRLQIEQRKEEIKNSISANAKTCLDALDAYGLDSKHFQQGSKGIWGYFEKNANSTERELEKEPSATLTELFYADEWATKTTREAQRMAIGELQPMLFGMFENIEKMKGDWLLLENMLQHFYKLSVIHEISHELRLIKSDKNQVLISDFNQALVNIILKEPVPFIYERLGEKYNHILIDEFQDTSVLQWNNLLPLLENGLAKGHFSLIVGDAKQAIYRWRGGDMEQIVHLANKRFDVLLSRHQQPDLMGIRYETINYTLSQERLNTNYRSSREIIEFNNDIFRTLADMHGASRQLLMEVYDLFSSQEVPLTAKTGGHIEIQFIDSAKEDDDTSTDGLSAYERRTLEAVLRNIQDTVDFGYVYRDVAVLCRQNKYARMVANFLKDRGIDVISQDSLLLQSSPAVSLLVSFFKILYNPDDALARYEALHLFYQHVLNEMPQLTPNEWEGMRKSASLKPLFLHLEGREFLLNPFRLQQMGLYELGATLVQTFQLKEMHGQTPYVYRFLDILLDFSVKQSNHLGEFMDYWDRKKENLSINTPKDKNAVTVTSVHKSKGLEYPVVLVPFADWDMFPRPGEIWWMSLDTSRLSYESPYLKDIPLRSTPITPKKELLRTPLKKQYEEDTEKLFIENLNMLYVALTRPIDRLYLLGKEFDFSKRNDRINVSMLLHDYLDHKELWEPHRPHYILKQGSLKPLAKPEAAVPETLLLTNDPTADWHKKARLRRMASRMFDTETFEKGKDNAQKLCEALRTLESDAQIELCLDKMEGEGTISEQERVAFRKDLQEIVSLSVLKPQFAPTAQVKPVKDILSRHTLNLMPPDRVVIHGSSVTILSYVASDDAEDAEKLLNRYAKALKQMGYQTVEKLIVNTQTLEVLTPAATTSAV